MSSNISIVFLRPSVEGDEEFYRSLYNETRAPELTGLGWDEKQVAAFAKMQYDARHAAYSLQFRPLRDEAILNGEVPIGRLLTFEDKTQIVIVDIAVKGRYRGKGVGTKIINMVKERAGGSGRSVVLRVDRANEAAFRLYRHLGFSVVSETEILLGLEWR